MKLGQFFLILLMWCLKPVTPDCVRNGRGLCIKECSSDTVLYTSGCQETMSQRTCKEPEPKSLGKICDLSRCDCVEPKVWDEAANKCVPYDQCTKEEPETDETC